MTSPKDVDGGWAWCVLGASYFNLMMCSGLSIISGIFQMILLEEFQGSVAMTSWITALFSGSMQMGGPLSSFVSNRYSCRTSVMAGGVFMSIGFLVSSLADNLTVLFLSLGVTAGIGIGLIYTSSIVVVSYFFHERRAFANGVILSGSGLGILLTPQIARMLYDNFSWRETFVILGAASAQVCISGALMFSCNEKTSHNDKDNVSGCHKGKGIICKLLSLFNCASLPPEDAQTESKREFTVMSGGDGTERNNEDECGGEFGHEKDLEPIVSLRPVPVIMCSDNDEDTSTENTIHDNLLKDKGENHKRSGLKLNTSNTLSDSRMFDSVNKTDRDNAQSSVQNGLLQRTLRKDCVIAGPKSSFSSDQHIDQAHKHFQLNASKVRCVSKSVHELELGHGHHRSGSLRHRRDFHLLSNESGNEKHTNSFMDIPVHASARSLGGRHVGNSSDALSKTLRAGSGCVIVSRNPSLLSGLVASTHQLDLILCDTETDLEKHKHGNFMERNVVFKTSQQTIDYDDLKNAHYSDGSEFDDLKTITNRIDYPPLYKNQLFWVLNLGLFVYNAGCGLFNIHVPSFYAETKGLTPQEITNAISMHGIMILVGRILTGALANSTKDLDLLIYIMTQVLGGLIVCLIPPLGNDYSSNLVLVSFVAIHAISTYALLPTLTIQYVGIERLATAFGVEMVFAGMGYLVAPPLAGVLVDMTGSYNYSMYISGTLFSAAGVVLFVVPSMLKSLVWYNMPTDTHPDTSMTTKQTNTPNDPQDDSMEQLMNCSTTQDLHNKT